MAKYYLEDGKKIGKFEWKEFTVLTNVSELHPKHKGYPINEIILAILKYRKYEYIRIEEQTKGGINIFKIPLKDYLKGIPLRTKKYPRHRVISKMNLDWREMFY
jgi:hypothetical protein